LLTAPLYRQWHLHWGATPAEIAEVLPGDALVPDAQFKATRATSIDALPEAVWPWLVQVGCLRAGFYGNNLLDNLSHPSATTIATADVTPREPHHTQLRTRVVFVCRSVTGLHRPTLCLGHVLDLFHRRLGQGDPMSSD